MSEANCPCGSGLPLAQCCGPRLDGTQPAGSAEQLMRSRYCAYVLGNEDYLLQTWHASTRPPQLSLTRQPRPKWLGLRILGTRRGTGNDDQGEVEFVARYKLDGRARRLHENSRFLKQDGRWFYLSGELKD